MMLLRIGHLNELPQAAKALLRHTAGKTVYAFYGNLGAGKTTLIQAICHELGVNDKVTSPTFTLVNEYKTGNNQPVFHFDFYRIQRIDEAFDLGYEDYFYSRRYCFIEWPEKIESLLPEGHVPVYITVEENGVRTMKFREI